MASILIPSLDRVRDFKLKQARYFHLRNDFIKTTASYLVNTIMIDPIRQEMEESGVSRKIWETVVLKEPVIMGNTIILRIHSEYFADNGFDVAVAREKGTDQSTGGKHWIRPKYKKSLRWIEGGVARFSQGHKVSGLPRLNIIEKTVERKTFEVQQLLNSRFLAWKKSIFKTNP